MEGTNLFDLDQLLALFADDALLNDQLCDHWGKSAIREWVARDIVGVCLMMDVTSIVEHYRHFIVIVEVRSEFDLRGLPAPLLLAFYFTPDGDKIVQLIILPSRFDI